MLYGDAKELQDLHKDLCDAKYSNSEIEEVVPLHFLYKSEQQQTHAPEGDGLSSLDDYDDDTFFRDNKPTDSEDRAPSLDAIFYDDSGPKTSKKKKKYKRRDWESMLPPGEPRLSGCVKARSAFSMFRVWRKLLFNLVVLFLFVLFCICGVIVCSIVDNGCNLFWLSMKITFK